MTDQAAAFVLDSQTNAIVVGSSYREGSFDFSAIKYNRDGIPLWTNYYHGPYPGDDLATAVAVDSSNNVYVAGASPGLDTFDDFVVLKYTPAGQLLWTTRYNALGGYDSPAALQVDASGNVYVTGSSSGVTTPADFQTLKYNASGALQWVKRYNGSGNGADAAVAIQLDAAGNPYITGSSQGAGSGVDIVTIKYDPTGNVLWQARYNGVGNGDDVPTVLKLDNGGNVYVAGYTTGATSGHDYVVLKYSSNGVASSTWTDAGNGVGARSYNGTANGIDEAIALAVDSSSNVCVTGSSMSGGGNFDIVTLMINPQGSFSWTNRFNGSGTSPAKGLVLGSNGSVYISGISAGGAGSDIVVLKLNSNGQTVWLFSYAGTASGLNAPVGVALDANGAVWTAGTTTTAATGQDFIAIQLNQGPWLTQDLSLFQVWWPGATPSLSVNIDGTGPLTFQWQFNGNTIPLATNSTINLTNSFAAAGWYQVKVTNSAGTITSSLENLVVAGFNVSGSGAQLTVAAPLGSQYRVDYRNSMDANDVWVGLQTLTGGSNPASVVDAWSGVLAKRFYRIVLIQ